MFTSKFFRVFDPRVIPGVSNKITWTGLVYTLGIEKNSKTYGIIIENADPAGKIDILSKNTGMTKNFMFNAKHEYGRLGADVIKLNDLEMKRFPASKIPSETYVFTNYSFGTLEPRFHAYFHVI